MFGVGLDVVEVERVAKILGRGPDFAERYFTAAERRACDARHRPARFYAAVLAAKEAFLKALGRGVLHGVELCDIEVVLGPGWRASVRPVGSAARALADRSPHLSLSWDGERSWAAVLLA